MTPTNKDHYNRLHQFLGMMGLSLPIILFIGSHLCGGCGHIQGSISAYYYTHFISIFCGFLFTIAIFLFTYQGPEGVSRDETRADRISSNIAGILALGIAVFPTDVPKVIDACNTDIQTWWCGAGLAHILCAGGFFLTLAYIALCIFTQTSKDKTPKPEKIFRNHIYKACGWIMIVCIACAGTFSFYLDDRFPTLREYNPIFVLETIMLWAFGISWLIKGDSLFADGSQSFQKLPEVLKPNPKK